MKDELEFLPAVLEIQETPPLAMGRYIVWAIMLFVTIAIIWASIGEVDIISVAHGKIIPGGKIKSIQPLETGMIRNIFVREGQQVEQGQPLVELDTTLASAEHLQVKQKQLALKLDRARLLSILERINPVDQSMDYFAEIKDATLIQIQLQKSRINNQLDEYQARKEALYHERKQHQAEWGAVVQHMQQLDATIPLVTERAESLAELLEKDMVPRVQWLELEQERIEQVKKRDILKNKLAGLESSIANVKQRLTVIRAEFESQHLTELADVESRIAAFEQEKIKTEKRVTLHTLKAPVSGTIHQLSIHTIGGVVTPAQALMHIVPDEGSIEIEAWLPNKDIGFVSEGQRAEIKVETFPFTKYGMINADIIQVSHDAVSDENLGLVYAMQVDLHKTTMQVGQKIVNLTPGMAVTVEINLGKRRLIEYLLSPLLRYQNESLKER